MLKKYKRRQYLKDPVIKEGIAREQQTGLRFCSVCDKFLPLSEFKTGRTRIFLCVEHMREMEKQRILGFTPRRAYMTLLSRARADLAIFGHKKVCITLKELIAKLTEEQIMHSDAYAIVPLRPVSPITILNSVIISNEQRRYLVTLYKRSKDPEEYEQALFGFIGPAGAREKREQLLPSRTQEQPKMGD